MAEWIAKFVLKTSGYSLASLQHGPTLLTVAKKAQNELFDPDRRRKLDTVGTLKQVVPLIADKYRAMHAEQQKEQALAAKQETQKAEPEKESEPEKATSYLPTAEEQIQAASTSMLVAELAGRLSLFANRLNGHLAQIAVAADRYSEQFEAFRALMVAKGNVPDVKVQQADKRAKILVVGTLGSRSHEVLREFENNKFIRLSVLDSQSGLNAAWGQFDRIVLMKKFISHAHTDKAKAAFHESQWFRIHHVSGGYTDLLAKLWELSQMYQGQSKTG